jgi:hypothetical protein
MPVFDWEFAKAHVYPADTLATAQSVRKRVAELPTGGVAPIWRKKQGINGLDEGPIDPQLEVSNEKMAVDTSEVI